MALVISPGVTTVGTTSSDQSGGAITIQADASGTTVTKSGNTITLGVSGTIPGGTATANKWTTARTVTFAGGDVTGSFTIDGSADVSNVALTVGADKVALGTDTTGNYVASLTAGTGVSVGAAGEGATPSIAIGQAVGTTDNVTFNDVTVSGSLTVSGTTTTINSTTISVDDKNIELGSVTSPTNTTADGGGITLKGATDKTFNWVNATSAWTSSEHVALAAGKNVLLNGSTSGTITLAVAATAGANTVTFPATTGNVVTTGDSGTVTNTMLAGSIANGKLANSSITVNGIAVSLGSSGTITANTNNTLTIGTGLSGSSFNGSAAVTIAIDSTVATLTGTQTLTNKTLTSPVIGTISNTGTLTLPTSTDTLVGRATSDTLTNKSLSDSTTYFINAADTTKRMQFQLSGISTTTTRTLTVPNFDGTIATLAGTETLTNKTLTSPVLNGLPTRSITAAVSAAGSNQAGATALTTMINNVTTVAASSGVVLPTAVAGMIIIVRNGGANALNVYPAVNASINAGSVNAAFSLAVGAMIQLVATSTTQWYTMSAVYA